MAAADQEPTTLITVKVKIHKNNDAMFFKVKRTARVARLLRIFCLRKGLAFRTVQFVFSGLPINENNTPAQLGMEEGDEIDVFEHQLGGGGVIVNMATFRRGSANKFSF